MTPSRRYLLLAGLLALALAGLTAFRGASSSDSRPVAPAPATSQANGSPATTASPDDGVTDVRLELLRPAGTASPATERNLFRFRTRVEPARPQNAVFVAPPPQAAAPQGPPPPPPIALRFIGLLDAPPPTGRVAILSDGRGNVFNGQEGDIIEGRYRVLRIGEDAAELAYLDGRGRQMIRLSGQ